jgi:hypothetical protein
LNERIKNLNLYFFENAYVCCKCYRLYQFLSDVYISQTEYHEEKVRSYELNKNGVKTNFTGMNNELNANILNIVKEKIDNIKSAKSSGRRSAVIDYKLKSPIN